MIKQIVLRNALQGALKRRSRVSRQLRLYLGQESSHESYASAKISDSLLACMWIAVDCGMNFVIVGEDQARKMQLLSQLSWFVDRLNSTLILEREKGIITSSDSKNNIRFVYGNLNQNSSKLLLEQSNLTMRFDRIALDRLSNLNAADLFSNAAYGVPFAASMDDNYSTNMLIEMFSSKEYNVNPDYLSMLDIHINASSNIISEYKWLSRAEIENGNIIPNGDAVSIIKLEEDSLQKSKILARFAELNGISIRLALQEIETRKKILYGLNGFDGYSFNMGISSYLSKFMI